MGIEVVDTETGELKEPACPNCEAMAVQLKGAEREVRAWRQRCAALERDDELSAREHPAWKVVVGLFDQWRNECGYPRARINAARFWMALPFLEKDGLSACRRAISGASFDPYQTVKKNGQPKAHNGWELIFRSREKFEDFIGRAPALADVKEVYTIAQHILERMGEDERPTEDRIFQAVQEAQRELRRP